MLACLKVMLHKMILNDNFQRNTALQHCCGTVSNGHNIIPALQRCIALKLSLRIVPCNITFSRRFSYNMTCLDPCPPPPPQRPSLEEGGGAQQNFKCGGSALRSNFLPYYIPFLAEKVPFSYTASSQMVPLSHTYSPRQQ